MGPSWLGWSEFLHLLVAYLGLRIDVSFLQFTTPPPPISLVQFTPLVQGLGWYSAFSVDVYAGSAHYAWWTSKSTHLTPAELLMSVSWNVKTCLRKGCDVFLHVFAVLLPTHKVICLCHNNSVSHFYHRLNSRKRGLGGIEKQWFVLFVPWHFSPSYALFSTDPC